MCCNSLDARLVTTKAVALIKEQVEAVLNAFVEVDKRVIVTAGDFESLKKDDAE